MKRKKLPNAIGALLFLSMSLTSFKSQAQLKFVVEDFEGLADGSRDLQPNGVFTFGSIKADIVGHDTRTQQAYAGKRNIRLSSSGRQDFGGWGKGMGLNVDLDAGEDFFNFYILAGDSGILRLELQEDDNGDEVYQESLDDHWVYLQKISKGDWQLISIPLNKFKDGNSGGDGQFNVSYKKGRLFSVVFSFTKNRNATANQSWSFDFICFSQGRLPVGDRIFSSSITPSENFCSLGAWSVEGNAAEFSNIPLEFEKIFSYRKKIGVAHFFQPFAFDGGSSQNLYPSVERVNKVIESGYIPMITLEDHFANTHPSVEQPNLYSIVEGHFDDFFRSWANEIKQVNGVVLLRILHEFNGDWYPWCLSKNDQRPELLVNAFRHIRNIFYAQDARNVKFVWCPNSMSVPQAKWNFIMDAYPGNEWVDFVGLDIYNGAGRGSTWRSFRKEGIENYFLLTTRLRDKPLLICETASREREANEPGQTKADWICQMGEALGTDMNKALLLCWFNEAKMISGEKKSFMVNSSGESQDAFLRHIINKDYFRSGSGCLKTFIQTQEETSGQK